MDRRNGVRDTVANHYLQKMYGHRPAEMSAVLLSGLPPAIDVGNHPDAGSIRRYDKKVISNMIAEELLRSANPAAAKFLQKSNSGRRHLDYKRLQDLLDGGVFKATSFDATRIDVVGFDWEAPGFDRNWWWQLQPLPFLEWYRNSYEIQSDEEKLKYYKTCRDAIIWWKNTASCNEKSPLAWHDHTVAYRLKNIANWLLFCHLNELGSDNDAADDALANILVQHFDWLKEDDHYSRHTNHGFDQAMMGLVAALMYSAPAFQEYRTLNRKRLKDEVEFAFTTEGVHKENSPGYQKTMTRRLRQLKTLSIFGESELVDLGERYMASAEEFLSTITLPNGLLPMVGDTRGGDVGLPYIQKKKIDICDYTASGYVIVRGTVLGQDFHLLFKNSHLSHYHRHDDDLSIHLYFGGHVFLGDGGLGSHNETDERRKLLRSCLSHNAPYIIDQDSIRVPSYLNGFMPSTRIIGSRIVGESYSYGIALRREVDLEKLIDGIITLRDTAPQSIGSVVASNFYSSIDCVQDHNCLHFGTEGARKIRLSVTDDTVIKRERTLHSAEFGKFTEASAISLSRRQGPKKNNVEVTLALF